MIGEAELLAAVPRGLYIGGVWQDGGAAPGQSWVGLRFLGVPPEAARRLRAWTCEDGSGP